MSVALLPSASQSPYHFTVLWPAIAASIFVARGSARFACTQVAALLTGSL
jgi:hypothetical protein